MGEAGKRLKEGIPVISEPLVENGGVIIPDATFQSYPSIFHPERIYGFEVALDTLLNDHLFLGSSLSYTEGKLDAQGSGDFDTYMNGDRYEWRQDSSIENSYLPPIPPYRSL